MLRGQPITTIEDNELKQTLFSQDIDLLRFLKVILRPARALSVCACVKRFQPLQHPSTLSAKELEHITENDENAEAESSSEYGPGGYMPISLGQTIGLKEQYCIIRKLGWGHFSTVWLCKDILNDQDYFAVKIIKASRLFKNVALDEIDLLKCVKEADPSSIGFNRVILLHEHFTEVSINGAHICMVFEIMGPSLLELLTQSDFQGIEQSGVKRIIKQVLEGLIYLHEICHIIHTDIKPENILITVKDSYVRNMVTFVDRFRELDVGMPKSYVSAITWYEHIELYGRPSSSKPLPPNKSSQYRDISWPENSYKKNNVNRGQSPNISSVMFIDPNIQVKIADLGNACWENKHFTSIIQTVQYRALEVIIDAEYNFPADMWSVACVAFEISTGEYLFNPQSSPTLSAAEDHLGLIWEVLDGIPKYIALNGKQSKGFFDPATGLLRHISLESMKIWKVEDVLVDKYGWKRVDAIIFGDFIQSLIEPDPELRATASSALQKKWLKELDI